VRWLEKSCCSVLSFLLKDPTCQLLSQVSALVNISSGCRKSIPTTGLECPLGLQAAEMFLVNSEKQQKIKALWKDILDGSSLKTMALVLNGQLESISPAKLDVWLYQR